jgi:hypothetical protein
MLEEKELLQIMLSEYGLIKAEMKGYIDLYHKHTNFVTLYLSIIVGLFGVVASWFGRNPGLAESLLGIYTLPWPYAGEQIKVYQLAGFLIYLVLAAVSFYFIAATISYIYIVEVLGKRAAVVERQINKLAGHDLLIWDTSICPRIIHSFVHKGLWISPSAVRHIWSYGLLSIVLVLELLTASALMGPQLGNIFIVLVGTGAVFQVVQVVCYRMVGVQYTTKILEQESAIRDFK